MKLVIGLTLFWMLGAVVVLLFLAGARRLGHTGEPSAPPSDSENF